jgi:PPOX class probable F420-dependent enzyme
MKAIPESHRDLIKDEKKAFAYLATIVSDGTPQVTPIWFNADEEHILINSARGRLKDRNMRARPSVALCIQDPNNSYRYLQIRGKVVEITTQGAEEHINTLNFKYHGTRQYKKGRPDEVRVTYKILPEKVDAHG